MKKRKAIKRFFCCMTILFLLVGVSGSALATGTSLHTSGSCKKAYTTSDSLTKSSSELWSAFRMTATTITYTGGGIVYAYARPVNTAGVVLSSRQKVHTTAMTTLAPNGTGTTVDTVKFKIENGMYVNGASSTITMTFVGDVTGVK